MKSIPKLMIDVGVAFARIYNRMETTNRCTMPEGPVLFVANHGFGGIVDLNLLAVAAAYESLGDDREVITLTHAMAWKLGAGRVVEEFDARPAGHDSATAALSDGKHVLVFPGGDLDAMKTWRNRNKVLFSGRSGFARLAMEAGVPIVPIVTSGAGESLFVISSGEKLAEITGAKKLLRAHSFPISLSVPWGLSIGLVGVVPYLPLPTKLETTILPAMVADENEDGDAFAERVHTAMQDEMDAQTRNRRPIVG
ncbi:MAG: 1-acyl-sn-glycerol-3-phosphate acyltransferase [Rhodococcus sp. (in: high G+C Gram-positive bacteria)]